MYVVKALKTKEWHRKNWWIPAGLAAAGALRYTGNRVHPKSSAYVLREIRDVRLSVCGETVGLRGLVDTGNCLYDGRECRPVCVMDKAVIEKELPLLKKRMERYLRGEYTEGKLDFHYLPYCSLGRPDGLALVFTAEYLIVQRNRSKRKTMHPRIAVADGSLLFDRAYQIILNPDVLRKKGGMKHGRLCSRQRTGKGMFPWFYQNTDTENGRNLLYWRNRYSSGPSFFGRRSTDDPEIS